MYIERYFLDTESRTKGESSPHRRFEEFSSPDSSIVLLGEPGSGKTSAFEKFASREPNSLYLTVRDFLVDPVHSLQGKILYIDALDEQRAKTSNETAVIDEVRKKLLELSSPKFRLSCRAADWYGDLDRKSLARVSQGTLAVIELVPLSKNDISQIASEYVDDPASFISEAETRRVSELLHNPQTLLLLLKVVAKGAWPDSRTDLLVRACEILLQEENEEHRHAHGQLGYAAPTLDEAGFVSAAVLLSGSAGFALSASRVTDSFPAPNLSHINQDRVLAVLKTNLFRASGIDRRIPSHRTNAEFLAARYLARKVREGLPPGRVHALIGGFDGGPLSDLRGVFGWLACLSPQCATRLISHDPFGIILYGDPANLSLRHKEALLQSLSNLADQNPWFRAENFDGIPFAALSTQDLVPYFRKTLLSTTVHEVHKGCVLDALYYGKPLPELAPTLKTIAYDATSGQYNRERALRIYLKILPGAIAEHRRLLRDVVADRLKDPQRTFRAHLLKCLYPSIVGPTEILKYLVPESPSYIGPYFQFVMRGLLQQTPDNLLPTLLDALTMQKPAVDEHSYLWKQFFGEAVLRGVVAHGESIAENRLYAWLGIALDQHNTLNIDHKHQNLLRDWIESRPSIFYRLLDHLLSKTDPAKFRIQLHYFSERIIRARRPATWPNRFLALAELQTDATIANELFSEAVSATWSDVENAVPLDDLIAFVHRHPRFLSTYVASTYCAYPDWRAEHQKHRQERKERDLKHRAENIAWLSGRRAAIQAGKDNPGLVFLAQIYFARFVDINREQAPEDRLRNYIGDELTEDALKGFDNFEQYTRIPSPTRIGGASSRSRHFQIGLPVLAGIRRLVAEQPHRLDGIDEKILQSAIAFELMGESGDESNLILEAYALRPDAVVAAIFQFWKPLFANQATHIPGFYDIVGAKPVSSALALALGTLLLKTFPDCKVDQLERLLLSVLPKIPEKILERLVAKGCRLPAKYSEQRTVWTTAALASKGVDLSALAREVRRKKGMHSKLAVNFYGAIAKAKISKGVLNTRETLVTLFQNCAIYIAPHGSPLGTHIEESNVLRMILSHLADGIDKETTALLAELLHSSRLTKWRNAIAESISTHERRRREALFRYLELQQVTSILNDGPPETVADMQALVERRLSDAAHEINHGVTRGHLAYWNVDSYGRPKTPRTEEVCRHALLQQIRPALIQRDVIAEPEGQYTEGNRADIKTMRRNFSIPVEVKRHYHAQLWTAPTRQLKKLYLADPTTGGRGIYLVLWFGNDFKPTPRSPITKKSAKSLDELLLELADVVPPDSHDYIRFIGVDCSLKKRIGKSISAKN